MLLLIVVFSTYTNGLLLPSKPLTLQEINLVRCLTHIGHRFFPPERSLVISSPTTYRDVQQELIAQIHRTSIWPVVVNVDGNIKIPNKAYFTDRDGSYIVLIPDGNIRSLITEIVGLEVDQTNYPGIWNSEARFVVAGANEFSMLQQTAIFDFFSQLRIYNCIILSQQHNEIEKKYSRPINVNDVDTSMKLGVYTWFPYQSSDRCTEVNDITLLDSWVISAQGHFTKKTDLFPRKISNNLKGCPMKALVRERFLSTSYVNATYSNGSLVSSINGPEMELLSVVLKQMNMTYFLVPNPKKFVPVNGNLLNLVIGMLDKEIYIALSGMGFESKITFQTDITNSYHFSTYRWFVPCSFKYPRWSSIFRVLSVEMWLVLIISIVIVSISTTLIGRYSCMSEWQGYKTLTDSFTHLWAVILGVSVSTMPRTPSLRSLFLAWVCFSLAFNTVFQVFFTTFLIDPGHKPQIRNMDELFASDIKFAYSRGVSDFYENGNETRLAKLQINHANCPSYDVCLNWAMYQKNVSIVLNEEWLDVNYVVGFFSGKNSEPLLCRLEDGILFTHGISMVMLYGDPLLRRVTEIIDHVVEAGIYNYWISQRMYRLKLYTRKIAIVHPLDGYYSFNLYHMQPAFYLLLMGWCLSALCFMVEVMYNRAIRKRM